MDLFVVTTMKFIEHNLGSSIAVEIVSDEVLINSEQDALDLMANIGYLYDSRKIIMYRKNLCDEFWNCRFSYAKVLKL